MHMQTQMQVLLLRNILFVSMVLFRESEKFSFENAFHRSFQKSGNIYYIYYADVYMMLSL